MFIDDEAGHDKDGDDDEDDGADDIYGESKIFQNFCRFL